MGYYKKYAHDLFVIVVVEVRHWLIYPYPRRLFQHRLAVMNLKPGYTRKLLIDGLVQERRNSSALAMELCFYALTHHYTPTTKLKWGGGGGGYTGFTLFVHPSVLPPSVSGWLLELFSLDFNFYRYMYPLGEDLEWDWIWASYLIKYAHNGW